MGLALANPAHDAVGRRLSFFVFGLFFFFFFFYLFLLEAVWTSSVIHARAAC